MVETTMAGSDSSAVGSRPGSHWADNDGVRIHYVDHRADAAGPAVLVVPGFGEDVDDHLDLLDAVAPRRAIAVDLRGRGRSDVPERGYDLAAHAADIDAAVASAGTDRVHLMTYSRGTAYGLSWAFAHVERLASLTIGDYPPAQLIPPANLPELAAARIWKGRRMTDRMPAGAVAQMVADATAVEFWEELGDLRVPVLVVRGGGGRVQMIDDTTAARYESTVHDLELTTFHESGHDLWRPDPDRFATVFVAFLDRVDRHDQGRAIPSVAQDVRSG